MSIEQALADVQKAHRNMRSTGEHSDGVRCGLQLAADLLKANIHAATLVKAGLIKVCHQCGDGTGCGQRGCQPTAEFITEMRKAATALEHLSNMYDRHMPSHYPWSAIGLRTEADYLERAL